MGTGTHLSDPNRFLVWHTLSRRFLTTDGDTKVRDQAHSFTREEARERVRPIDKRIRMNFVLRPLVVPQLFAIGARVRPARWTGLVWYAGEVVSFHTEPGPGYGVQITEVPVGCYPARASLKEADLEPMP